MPRHPLRRRPVGSIRSMPRRAASLLFVSSALLAAISTPTQAFPAANVAVASGEPSARTVAGRIGEARTVHDRTGSKVDSPAHSGAGETRSGSDAPPCTTADLLQIAHEVALAIPMEPHEKDRARALESVFSASVASGDIERARRASGQMSNWRRGVASARLAEHFQRAGEPEEAERHLEIALRIAKDNEDWRRDRIRVAIARTRLLMGQAEEAARLEAGVEPSEMGKADAIRVAQESEEQFEERLAILDRVLEIKSFDLALNHTSSLEELYRRYHVDAARREQILRRVRGCIDILPLAERIAFLLRLSEIASSLDDRESARGFVADAQAYALDGQWLLEDQVPQMARVAVGRHLAGEEELALLLAAEAAHRYETGRAAIVDVFRADAIRPLAEAYARMGRPEEALRHYRQTVEEGAINPNARPRAVDLCRTASSMASHRIDADADLCRRMREIQGALGEPW